PARCQLRPSRHRDHHSCGAPLAPSQRLLRAEPHREHRLAGCPPGSRRHAQAAAATRRESFGEFSAVRVVTLEDAYHRDHRAGGQAMSEAPAQRPGGVTFIGVLVVISAILYIISGVIALFASSASG